MATVGTWDVLGVYVGDRLGLYRILADRGPCTSADLSDAAGLNQRYVREWLEQRAASGILELEDAGSHSGDRRFLHEVQARFTRPMFDQLLTHE